MQALEVKKVKKVVFFGTGGTISGLSEDSNDTLNYKAGLIGVGDLAKNSLFKSTTDGAGKSNASEDQNHEGAELTGSFQPVYEQIAQVDSKDMQFYIWQKLLERILFWKQDPDVLGFLITHGTDTIEETAFFLSLSTHGLKNMPTIALTCAMLPASAKNADGPQNLRDATAVLVSPKWQQSGVVVVCAGEVHHAAFVQKLYSDRLNAFSSLPFEPIGRIDRQSSHLPFAGVVRVESALIEQPLNDDFYALLGIQKPSAERLLQTKVWPWVEIVQNYAQNSGDLVRALSGFVNSKGQSIAGIVTAGTGVGTVSEELSTALQNAKEKGVLIWQSSKCAFAQIKTKQEDRFYNFHGLSPVKARIALIMHILAISSDKA